MKVYLDNGATTKVDNKVVEAMLPFFEEKYGNASSLHIFGQEAYKSLDGARKTIAAKLNAQSEEIIFTSGGSEANNLAIKGIINREDHIITVKTEHPSVLNTIKELEKQGVETTYLNVTKEGYIDFNELIASFKENTKLVSIMHANNEIGVIQDIRKVYNLCKKKKIIFHTDAVQSFGKAYISSEDADLISISAHKIHGPKGVGTLYVKKGIRLKPQIFGGDQEGKQRAGTENIPGIAGFAKATELITEKEIKQMESLRDYFINELLKIKDTKLNGPRERLCNNINISFKYIEGEAILTLLDFEGIAVSTGSACSSKSLEPSHVLKALNLNQKEIHGTIRFTISKFTTKEELDYSIDKIKMVVEKLRKISPLRGDKDVYR